MAPGHDHGDDREHSSAHHAGPGTSTASRNRVAFRATLHCLTGCAVGEISGMALGGALGWSAAVTVAVSVLLAFAFGYLLTMRPLLAAGIAPRRAMRLAAASDTISIGIMEIVDNVVMLVVPGAMDAGPASLRFWLSMAASLALAGVAAFPVNRWLIARGRGHAVVHGAHAGRP